MKYVKSDFGDFISEYYAERARKREAYLANIDTFMTHKRWPLSPAFRKRVVIEFLRDQKYENPDDLYELHYICNHLPELQEYMENSRI